MISKQKNEKTIKPKSKNSIISPNIKIKNVLLSSQINVKSSNKSDNKFTLKKIKNNSIPSFMEKKKVKIDLNKKNIILRNSNHLHDKFKTSITKTNKVINRINNEKSQDNLYNICKLSKFLKNTDLKETIIIDNEGNNNLDLIIKDKNKNFDKNTNIQKDNNLEKIKEGKNSENIYSEFKNLNSETCCKNNLINKDCKEKQNIDNNYISIHTINNTNTNHNLKEEKNPNRDSKRLNEYGQIFQLINDNIEQFKDIINKKDRYFDNKENKKNNNNINVGPNFLSSREYYRDSNNEKINKGLIINNDNKYKYIQKSKPTNSNVEENTLNNSLTISKDKNNIEIYSFIDSFTQDELLKPSDNKHQKQSSKSLSYLFQGMKKDETIIKINKKDIDRISSNEMSTNNKCYEDEDMQIELCGTDEQINYDTIKNRDINPHFFSNDINNNMNNDKKKDYIEKECYIF